MLSHLRTRFARTRAVLNSRPVLLATLTGGARCLLGDEIAQRWIEGRKGADIDRWRSVAFAAFGFGWCGVAQFFIYSRLLPAAASAIRRAGLWNATWKTELAIENLGTNVFLYYPVFYYTHASVRRKSFADPAEVFAKWRHNVVEDTMSCASFWVPANAMNFAFVPVNLRAPVINVLGVAWLVILSSMRGNDGAADQGAPVQSRDDVDPLLRRYVSGALPLATQDGEAGARSVLEERGRSAETD